MLQTEAYLRWLALGSPELSCKKSDYTAGETTQRPRESRQALTLHGEEEKAGYFSVPDESSPDCRMRRKNKIVVPGRQ